MKESLVVEPVADGLDQVEFSSPAAQRTDNESASSVWVARALILAVTLGMAWYTWGHWGDFQIDCGREIYVPAAILKGKLLFRDVWYMYGPLAPYIQALLFRIFSVHLTVLYAFGLALTCGFALVTFEISRQLHLTLPASVMPPLFFLVEAFYPFIRNFIFPYSYAAALGAFLGLTCLYFVLRHASTQRRLDLGLAALVGSLAILSKQEFGIACLALLGFATLARYIVRRSPRELVRNIALCLVGLAPAMAVYGWFVWKVSARVLFLENWIATPGTYFMRTFSKYGWGQLGFRLVPAELLELAEYAILATALWYLFASLNAFAIHKLGLQSRFWMAVSVAVSVSPLAVTSFIFRKSAPWGMVVDTLVFARSLWESTQWRLVFTSFAEVIFPSGIFLFVLFYVLHILWQFWRTPPKPFPVQEIAIAMYAILVGVRQMVELEPTLYKCAVFFNVPAFVIFIILVDKVIRWGSRGLDPRRRDFVAGSMLIAETAFLFMLFFPKPQILAARLTTDYGSFYTSYDVAALFPQIISFMKTHTENGRDILVLPEPPSLYVFAGLQAPTRWYSLMPGYVAPEQEPQYIEDLKLNHVKYVLIGKHDVSEYGVRRFEEGGYNQGIYYWIMANYVRVGQIGPVADKTTSSAFYFVSIYKRKGGD